MIEFLELFVKAIIPVGGIFFVFSFLEIKDIGNKAISNIFLFQFIVAVFATIICIGKSVTTPIVIILIWFIFRFYKLKNPLKNINGFLFLIGVFSILFFLNGFRYVIDSQSLFVSYRDLSIYSNIFDAIFNYRIETNSIYGYEEVGPSNPYHYFDLYIGGFFGLLSNSKTVLGYAIIGPAFVSTLIFHFFFIFFKENGWPKPLAFFIPILLLNLSGLNIFGHYITENTFLDSLLFGSYDRVYQTNLNFLRSQIFSINILVFFWAIQVKKEFVFIVIPLFLLCFVSVTFLPFSILAIVSILVFEFYKKSISKMELALSLLALIIIVSFYVALYFINPEGTQSTNSITRTFNYSYLFDSVLYFGKYLFRILFLFSFLILLILDFKQSSFTKTTTKYLILSFLGSLALGSLLHFNGNGIQFFTNASRDTIIIFTIFLFGLSFDRINSYSKPLIFTFWVSLGVSLLNVINYNILNRDYHDKNVLPITKERYESIKTNLLKFRGLKKVIHFQENLSLFSPHLITFSNAKSNVIVKPFALKENYQLSHVRINKEAVFNRNLASKFFEEYSAAEKEIELSLVIDWIKNNAFDGIIISKNNELFQDLIKVGDSNLDLGEDVFIFNLE